MLPIAVDVSGASAKSEKAVAVSTDGGTKPKPKEPTQRVTNVQCKKAFRSLFVKKPNGTFCSARLVKMIRCRQCRRIENAIADLLEAFITILTLTTMMLILLITNGSCSGLGDLDLTVPLPEYVVPVMLMIVSSLALLFISGLKNTRVHRPLQLLITFLAVCIIIHVEIILTLEILKNNGSGDPAVNIVDENYKPIPSVETIASE